LSRFFSIIFISSLFGASVILLIYKTSLFFIDRKKSVLVSLAFGLGTPIFYYSTVFMGVITATLLSFLSFYFVLKDKIEGIDRKYYYLIGILSGFSIVIEYFIVIIPIFIILYVLINQDKESLKRLFIGLFIGLTPLLIYNAVIFGTPFEVTAYHVDSDFFKFLKCRNDPGGLFCTTSDMPQLNLYEKFMFILPRIIVLPSRGLLFYSPLLIISFIGLYLTKENNGQLKMFIAGITLSFVIFNTLYFFWFAGHSFGPRYLIPIIPFLSIPFLFEVKNPNFGRFGTVILVILISVSIFHNFLGFNNWRDISTIPIDKYSETLKSTDILSNPLYEDCLNNFIEHGPRSQLLLGLKEGDLELSYMTPYFKNVILFVLPMGFLTLNLTYLPLFLVVVIFLLIWYVDIKKFISKFNKNLFYITVAIAIIFFILFFLNNDSIYYGDSWYPKDEKSPKRWMSQNGTINLFSTNNLDTNLNISMDTYLKPRHLKIFLNSKKIGSYLIGSTNEDVLIPDVKLKRGANTLKFYTEEGCEFPIEKNHSGVQCLSVSFNEYSMLSKEEILESNDIYYYNWYDEFGKNKNKRWMSKEGRISIFSNNTIFRPSFRSHSFLNNRTIQFRIDSMDVGRISIPARSNLYSLPIIIPKFNNEIRLESLDGCDIPHKINASDEDDRCLSVFIEGLDLSKGNNILKMIGEGSYDGWHVQENPFSTPFRWMSQNASLPIFNNRKETFDLKLNITSYSRKRTLYIYNNKKLILERNIIPNKYENVTIGLKHNLNDLKFYSESGCSRPSSIENISDDRCLSFRFENMVIV
ncbi:MAG: ArnT family glycosyltransferase, partial [Candidatus Aenigmatarchaeota archaeon]